MLTTLIMCECVLCLLDPARVRVAGLARRLLRFTLTVRLYAYADGGDGLWPGFELRRCEICGDDRGP